MFTFETQVVALDGDTAVVRARVRYGDPVRQKRRPGVVQFDDKGRCISFDEWPFWPAKPWVGTRASRAASRSISPSSHKGSWSDREIESTQTVREVAAGLESLLSRLTSTPGRWILAIEDARRPSRYVQFLCDEEGVAHQRGDFQRLPRRVP